MTGADLVISLVQWPRAALHVKKISRYRENEDNRALPKEMRRTTTKQLTHSSEVGRSKAKFDSYFFRFFLAPSFIVNVSVHAKARK